MAKRKKLANEYSNEYQVNIVFDPRDNIYVARVPELQGCCSHGKSADAALANANAAIKLWIETAESEGLTIPLPASRRKYSGKFVLRTSSEIHAELAQAALQLGKSLNELAVDLLARGLKIQ